MAIKGILVGLALVALLSGCSATGSFPHSSNTTVDLSQKNYKMIRPNAIGSSTGFALLGIVPFASPRYTNAMAHLYEDANLSGQGAYALANVVQERSTTYLILFSLPKLSVRADIIEFTE